jgi:hypothetical protein
VKRLFFAQIFGAAFAATIFQLKLDPKIAGLFGGVVFVIVGIFGMLVSWRDRKHRRLVVVVGGFALTHVFGVALPMLGFRVLYWNEPFSSVAVWGLSGPTFHSISTRIYGLWMIVTVLAWWRERKKDPGGSFFQKK